MDDEHARSLLRAERLRVEQTLSETISAGQDDRSEANQPGDLTDPAERLTAEQADDAVAEGLRERLLDLDRAERRLENGRFGFSIRSGLPIPDERLEADPTVELTVDEVEEG